MGYSEAGDTRTVSSKPDRIFQNGDGDGLGVLSDGWERLDLSASHRPFSVISEAAESPWPEIQCVM